MAHISQHPSPGLGNLLPGWTVYPGDPDVMPRRVVPIGDLLPGAFPVPQNPLLKQLAGGVGPKGVSGCGCNGEGSGTAYINGQEVDTSEYSNGGLMGVDWLTVAIAAGAAVLLARRGR